MAEWSGTQRALAEIRHLRPLTGGYFFTIDWSVDQSRGQCYRGQGATLSLVLIEDDFPSRYQGFGETMILFITRKYPPSIGGMQKLSYGLTTEIARRRPAWVLSWGGTQKLLPAFLVTAFVRACMFLLTHKVDIIHLGDPVLAPLGIVFKMVFKRPVTVTVHGLDIAYSNPIYQWIIPRMLTSVDAVIPISTQAYYECVNRGVSPERCFIIPAGIDPTPPVTFTREQARRFLSTKCGTDLAQRHLLLTIGRLVARKGVAHFVENTLPIVVRKLPQVLYLVVGDGPDREKILGSVHKNNLENHVKMLGVVDQETLWAAYRATDVFVMPNIPICGDLEGFGLVILEACIAECCVVASNIEGIRDAIENGHNGLLVPAADPFRQAETILHLFASAHEREVIGRRAREFVAERFSWSQIADRYLQLFDRITAQDEFSDGAAEL